jgi:hypothetical protein
MGARAIFGLQVLLSLVGYALIARFYAAPRLAALPLPAALTPLLLLHAFPPCRHGIPGPGGRGNCPAGGLRGAGGLRRSPRGASGALAIAALRNAWSLAIPLVWLFNIEGTLDLINAFYQGLRNDVQLGAAYYIPTFVVPALFVTHAMIFAMLIRRTR